MTTKRRLNEDTDEDSDEIDSEDSEIPQNLEDDSEASSDETWEPSEEAFTDEDDWHQSSDVSSVEDGSEDDDGDEPNRNHSDVDQQSSSGVFMSKSGRQWDKREPPNRKIPQVNILRQRCSIRRSAAHMQTIKDAFQLLFTEDIVTGYIAIF